MPISIRPWTMADQHSLAKYANNPNITRNLTDAFPYPYTLENAQTFIERVSQENPVHVFAIDLNGEAIGGIGVHPLADVFRKNMELGYWLAEPHWGKGYVVEAIQFITHYAFEQFDITRIFARPYGRNIASQKVLEKSGFLLEAHFHQTLFKNGQFEDELVYALRRPTSNI